MEMKWDKYKELLGNKKMNTRKKLDYQSKVTLNYFIYQVRNFDIPYNDRIGDLYKIDNGEDYFQDGKLIKKINYWNRDFI